ncbi:unnamed protein product [Ambrosiozyma monospora]|uniref:Unnamed protein product n=1 Tax=Ambrosiozyma monospora TaxID=43982 RepID=A0ACB5SX95_AMBMO|nr:unnamed protein product [Ambrosiozyma monospora]
MTNSTNPTPFSATSSVKVEFITLPISHLLKLDLEPELISIINRGYNKPRFKYGIIDTPRVKSSLLKDFVIDENMMDDVWLCLALSLEPTTNVTGMGNVFDGSKTEVMFDTNDSGSELTKKLIQKYPIGTLNFDTKPTSTSNSTETTKSIITKSAQLLHKILLLTTPSQLEFQVLGTIVLRPYSSIPRNYSLTAYTSFYPGVSTKLFTYITHFAKQQLGAKKLWIDVIEEHDLVGFYEKLGFVLVERTLCKVDPVSKILLGKEWAGLEDEIRANCNFHFVSIFNFNRQLQFQFTRPTNLKKVILKQQPQQLRGIKSKTKKLPKMSTSTTTPEFKREQLESVLKRRFFYAPAFEIYGGVAGLYDYGPPGCALQANVIDAWRKHFVLEEDMLEVDTTMLTPYEVLKTSGHVDKFSDWMCRDLKTGEIFRADHLIEEVLEARLKGDKQARGQATEDPEEQDDKKKKRKKKVKEIKVVKLDDATVKEYETILAKIDGFSGADMAEIIKTHNITNPATGGPLEPPIEFNLMFETAIGPSGQLKGYLRPETAQGQFLNFNKLLDFNNEKMPFASASIGKSFRNEISPRAGLLRVREFLMAEIEHFVDPEDKSHPSFVTVKDIKLTFLPKEVQESGSTKVVETTIGEAVKSGMVDNETLGYFIARIFLFLTKIGVDPKKLRFRQHMANEMAHYAQDCWDAELQTSYGWIECVGCADRSAYDLTVHAARTKERLTVRQALPEPKVVEVLECDIEKKKFGPKFRKNAPKVEQWLLSRTECELEKLAKELETKLHITADIPDVGETEIPGDLVKITKKTKTEHVREFTPNVIEPSFGIGRYFEEPSNSIQG